VLFTNYLEDKEELPIPSTATVRITARTWLIMAALALTGQIAWAVENSWFNTFVYDTITPDPPPVAWMVAASAITATLTTLVMGTLSDRTCWRWGGADLHPVFPVGQ
jgi:hypothetical protein